MSQVTILVENTYADGHSSEAEVGVALPASQDEESLEQWWEEVVHEQTGDGHGAVHPRLGFWYEVTVTDAPEFFRFLVGQTREWGG